MPRMTKAQATANKEAAIALQAAGIVPAAPVANAPVAVVTPAAPTIVIPPPPPGMDKAIWDKYFLDNIASKVQAPKAPRASAAGITELTKDTAQVLVDAKKIAATVDLGKHGQAILLHTVADKEIYSRAHILDGKVVDVDIAHVDRVHSPRCLPRALRMLGTWIGEQGWTEFQNGPTGKVAPVPAAAAAVVLTPAEVKEVAATGSVQTPRAEVKTPEMKAKEVMAKAEAIASKHTAPKQAAKKVAAKKTAKR